MRPDERRQEIRKATRIHVELVAGGHHFQGFSKNISGSGVLMTVESGFPPDTISGQHGTVWLDFDDMIIDFSCIVVRVRGVDIAVMFNDGDVDKVIAVKKRLA